MTEWVGDEPWHDTNNGYTNMGCRCELCRGARARYRKEERMRKVALLKFRADGDGAGQTMKHGKAWNYTSGACLCRLCRGAASEASRAYKKARLEKAQAEAKERREQEFKDQWEGMDGAF